MCTLLQDEWTVVPFKRAASVTAKVFEFPDRPADSTLASEQENQDNDYDEKAGRTASNPNYIGKNG